MAICREQRAKLIFRAETYERKSKLKGKRCGDLMPSGIQVLRCIAFRFMNLARNAAWPSIETLCRATGLCRDSVCKAVRRLEQAGFLLVARRAGWNGRMIVRETNIYSLPVIDPVPLPDDHLILVSGRQTETQEYIWETSPVNAALARLGAAIGTAKNADKEE